jgi:hypothetical protein
MGKFADNVWFETETCCNCGMAFAMEVSFQRARRADHKSFYCPAGHGQHYTGKTEEQKLREQLEQEQRRLEQARTARDRVIHERDAIAKAHKKMRVRVANGVCPCCNRSFDNLRSHMATQHSDFGQEKTLLALRTAFGMTQAAVAQEAGTKAVYVSLYERGRPVPAEARESLNWWQERQSA